MMEEWKPIAEFSGYAVSNLGRIKRIRQTRGSQAGRILKQRINGDGYPCITLQECKRRKGYLVNRLVCEAFHGSPPAPDYHAAHGDGVRSNNRADNLRWLTRAENEADKQAHGTHIRGEDHANAKLTTDQVRKIRTDDRPQALIAAEHGVAQSLVSQVKNRRIWEHVE